MTVEDCLKKRLPDIGEATGGEVEGFINYTSGTIIPCLPGDLPYSEYFWHITGVKVERIDEYKYRYLLTHTPFGNCYYTKERTVYGEFSAEEIAECTRNFNLAIILDL